MRLADIKAYSEKKLADDIRKGNETAMKKLYNTYSGYLLALCCRYIPDKETAEDILQDSFIKIFSSFDKFSWKGSGSVKAWISRVTVNEALQYLRRQKKWNFVELPDKLPDKAEETAEEEPEVSEIPNDVLMKMIQELSDGYRTIFNLFVFEGKSHKEIAEMLGITESTSASQFHRARKILAKKITEYKKQESI